LRFPSFLQWLTVASLWLERLGPLLFFAPIRLTRVRTATFLAFFLFHLGIGATLYLGTLPYVFLIPLFALLPPPVWNAVEAVAKRRRKTVKTFLASAASAIEPWLRPAARALPGLLMAFVGLYQLASNFETLEKKSYLPESLRWMVTTFRLDQDWGMFAPYPYKSHGWYVIEAVDANGKSVSVLDREPAMADGKTPESVPALHRNGHWLSYSILVSTEHTDQLYHYAAYLCRKDPRAAEVRLAFMRTITPPTPDVVKPSRLSLLTHHCKSRVAVPTEDIHAR